jgi:hypothetical protein
VLGKNQKLGDRFFIQYTTAVVSVSDNNKDRDYSLPHFWSLSEYLIIKQQPEKTILPAAVS